VLYHQSGPTGSLEFGYSSTGALVYGTQGNSFMTAANAVRANEWNYVAGAYFHAFALAQSDPYRDWRPTSFRRFELSGGFAEPHLSLLLARS
ncbi:hypothetical protein, partial [Salmonella sp. SAL4431]|uniref:hypothetical protein n=1 Tax=Salmonella sp. SAL4431 TaxID=3159886 RepID=UPI003979D1DA